MKDIIILLMASFLVSFYFFYIDKSGNGFIYIFTNSYLFSMVISFTGIIISYAFTYLFGLNNKIKNNIIIDIYIKYLFIFIILCLVLIYGQIIASV